MEGIKQKKPGLIDRLINRAKSIANYCWTGVWRETRSTFRIRAIRTVNLTVRSFLDRDMQVRSMSLTYGTVLAIVPAFAMLFAIARGFGFQNIIHDQIFSFLPAQQKAINTALGFVDSYLAQASQGIFVGIGLIFLFWTMISLLSSIEDAFNLVWDIKQPRTFSQKITDYISVCLIVPILLVCSAGVSIFMSSTLQDHIHLKILTPLLDLTLGLMPLVLCWLAFAMSYWLMPNTKVKFKYAAIGAIFASVAFMILEILFVNGQIYVSKYNAIYGSFAFLPLLLVWLQLTWLVVLAGCALTYSMQNVFGFNFIDGETSISINYMRKLTVVITAIILKRFREGGRPLTVNEIAGKYSLPVRLVGYVIDHLHDAGVIYKVSEAQGDVSITAAIEPSELTIGKLFSRLDNLGKSGFIPAFSTNYGKVVKEIDSILKDFYDSDNKLVIDMPVTDKGH